MKLYPLFKQILIGILLIGLFLLAYVGFVLVPNARQDARRTQIRGTLFFLAFLARNYLDERNLPPSEFRSSRKFGDQSLSWRVYTYLYIEHDFGSNTREIDELAASGKYNLPESAPAIFQMPIDHADPTWTDILALTTDSEDNGKSPTILAFVAVPDSGVRWTEMKDLTCSEFTRMIARRTDDSPSLYLITTDQKYATITGRNQLTLYLADSDTSNRDWTTHDLQRLLTPSLSPSR